MATSTDKSPEGLAPRPGVLVVDDDAVARRLVVKGLAVFDCDIYEAADGAAARKILCASQIHVVITDLVMPKMSGQQLMQWGRRRFPSQVWLVLSGLGTFDAAVEAIRQGAFDFIAKPFRLQELQISVRNAIERWRLQMDRQRLDAQLHKSNVDLAHNVNELQLACETLEGQRETIARDLQRAEVIQRALLPHEQLKIDRCSVHALYRPARYVGGDLYDVILAGDRVVFYLADAAGHGVTAAMLSVLFKQRLRPVVDGEVVAPAEVLRRVNAALLDDIAAPGMFLTAAYGVYDTASGQLDFASAGHPPVLLRRMRGGEPIVLARGGPGLGLRADATFEQRSLMLEPGDRLLVYTDGLLDSPGEQALDGQAIIDRLRDDESGGSEFGHELFASSAAANADDDDHDDVTILLLEARPGESTFDNGERSAAGDSSRTIAAGPSEPRVYFGETDDFTFLTLRGRVTWLYGDAVEETARACIDSGRAMVIDLGDCEYLDSTCLGIMYAIVRRARQAGVGLSFQRVSDDVAALFDELDLHEITDLVRSESIEPMPAMRPVVSASSQRGQQMRVARAHELLASLSHSHREQFLKIASEIRGELSR